MDDLDKPCITLKVKRHEYQITSDDTFLDNGSCVQLTSQSKENCFAYSVDRPNPVLSQRTVKEIASFERMQLQHGYGSGVQLFSLNIK